MAIACGNFGAAPQTAVLPVVGFVEALSGRLNLLRSNALFVAGHARFGLDLARELGADIVDLGTVIFPGSGNTGQNLLERRHLVAWLWWEVGATIEGF